MPERRDNGRSLRVRAGQPLIGVVVREDGERVTHYFTADDTDADGSSRQLRKPMRSFAGIWKDLDWADAEQALDRIRHQSKPTPPLEEV